MKFKTKIGYSSPDKTVVRGVALSELIKKHTFAEAVFLAWTGKMPSKAEARVMNAMLVSAVEHGVNVPTVLSARIVASAGVSVSTAIAAGVLSVGEHHGGAIEQCAKLFQERMGEGAGKIVSDAIANKKRLPGFGHKIYVDADPRTMQLLEIARENKLNGKYVQLALDIEKELEKAKGKKLCLNVDGAIAALLSEMGFHWLYGKAFFALSRSVGISAHVVEEMLEEKPFRRLDDSEVEYVGK